MNIVKKALPLILLTLIIILVMQPVTVWADEPPGFWQSQIDDLDEPVIISKWGSQLKIDEDLYIHKNVVLQCDYSIVLSDANKKTIAAGKTLTLKTKGGPAGLVLLSNVTAVGPDAKVIIDTSSSNGDGGEVILGFFDDSGGYYPSLIINCSGGNGGRDGTISYNSSLQFSSAAYTVNDGETAAITVSRTISDVGKVRVQYSTSDGTAQAGTDYTPVSGVLEFANGESQKTFYVSTNDISGASRTVNLILSNPDAWATLGDQTTAVLTIEDNDPVCEIGTTPYSTLDEALSAVAAGETKTIKLLADIEYTSGIVITGKTVTFDLNGHTLNVTNDGGHGLEVGSGGVVNLDTSKGGSFNVTASGSAKYAIYAHDGGQATVTSATASGSGSRAVYAHDGGQVTVTSATLTSGDENSRGAMASGAGSFIWVTGNITAGSGYGAFAENGGSIEVGGNVTGGSCGVYAMGSGSVITIAGNAEATISDYYNSGARADDGAAVTVGGNVISKGDRAAYTYGAGSLLIIEGAVSTDYGGGAGAEAKDNSTIIIKGTITAPNYLRLDGEAKAASEWTNVDAGYKIYNNGISIIKVKNNPPAAKSPVPTQSVTAGSTAAFCASDIAVDIEEDSLIITAIVTGPEAAKATASLNSGTVTLTGVAVGDTSVVVTVSDGTDTVNIAVPVSVSPAPPTLVTSITVKGADDATTVANGGTLQMIAEVEPANATDKTVTWSVFPGTGTATIDPSTGLLTGTGEGTVTVRATANDGSGVYGEKVITVTEALPGNTPPNRKPGIPPTATASAAVNTAYTLDLSTIFEDADGDLLTYKVSVNGGAYVAADRVYSYTPTVSGTTTLVFKAHDGTVDSSDTYTVTLTVSSASSGGSGGGGSSGGSSGGESSSTTPSNSASKSIPADTGGSVQLENVSVEVPSGTLPADTTLKIEKLTGKEAEDLVPSGLQVKLGSDIYEITTTGSREFGDNTITIRIAFDPDKIAEGEQPVIRYRDETTGEWVDLPTIIDQGADGKWYAVTHVNHLTKFAVFSAPVPTEEEPVRKIIVLTLERQDAIVDGKPYILDAPPFLDTKANRTLAPVRFVSEALGAEVAWVGETRQVVIRDGDKEIMLTIGSAEVLVNGERQTIDSAPELHPPGRTFVPLRFVSETLGATVGYDPADKRITVVR